MHTYTHTYMHACIHTYIHTYIHTHTPEHTYIRVYMCRYAHIGIILYMGTNIDTGTRRCTHRHHSHSAN